MTPCATHANPIQHLSAKPQNLNSTQPQHNTRLSTQHHHALSPGPVNRPPTIPSRTLRSTQPKCPRPAPSARSPAPPSRSAHPPPAPSHPPPHAPFPTRSSGKAAVTSTTTMRRLAGCSASSPARSIRRRGGRMRLSTYLSR